MLKYKINAYKVVERRRFELPASSVRGNVRILLIACRPGALWRNTVAAHRFRRGRRCSSLAVVARRCATRARTETRTERARGLRRSHGLARKTAKPAVPGQHWLGRTEALRPCRDSSLPGRLPWIEYSVFLSLREVNDSVVELFADDRSNCGDERADAGGTA